MRTAFIPRYQWIALFESNQQCANTHTKRDHTNIGFRRVLLVSICFLFMFALPMHIAPKCVLSIRWNLGRTHV